MAGLGDRRLGGAGIAANTVKSGVPDCPSSTIDGLRSPVIAGSTMIEEACAPPLHTAAATRNADAIRMIPSISATKLRSNPAVFQPAFAKNYHFSH